MSSNKQSLSSIKKIGGINLLPQEMRVPGRFQLMSRFLRQGSFVVLGVYIFVLILLLITSYLFTREERMLRAKNASLSQEVENFKNKEGLLAILKNRARLAQVVFTKSPQIRDNLIDDIIDTFSSGTQVSEISSESGLTNVTAVAPNSQETKEIFAKLQNLESSQIILKTLSLESTGGYSFSLEVK